MGSPLIGPGDLAMADDLAPRLRAADAAELEGDGFTPLEGLKRACALSAQLHSVTASGEVVALFGFAELEPDVAAPWLLGSEALVTTHRLWFLRHTPEIVSAGDRRWSRFFNLVDARNTVHVRWLRWAGFRVQPPIPNGPVGLPYHPIERIRPCAVSLPL